MLLGYQNMKIFLQKVTLEISLKKFLSLKRVKNTVPWAYVIYDSNREWIVEPSYKTELQKQIKKNLELKKQSREKAINYMLNGKHRIIG